MSLPVSIIISSYNHARFVAATVESALAQTEPAEVIVVDDGSTDGSAEVLQAYAGDVRLIRQPNAGQAAAMNRGVAESRGELLIFLDCDDLLLPHAAEAARAALANPAAAKAHWQMIEIDAAGRRTGRLLPEKRPSSGDLTETILRDGPEAYDWPPTSGNAWRRSAVAPLFPIPAEPFRVCPDVYLAAVVPLCGPIVTVDESLSCWRRHDRNNTWGDRFEVRLPRFRRQWDLACDALVTRCAEAGLPADSERWRANAWCHRVGRAVERICAAVPAGATFCLIDQGEWGVDESFFGRRCLPFPHREGRFYGLPAQDEGAIAELEAVRREGVEYFVLAWPAFWWREFYPRFAERLLATGRFVSADDDVVIVRLPPAA